MRGAAPKVLPKPALMAGGTRYHALFAQHMVIEKVTARVAKYEFHAKMNSGRRTARQEEEIHVQRRNAELRKQEHWNNVAKYFKTWDVTTSKYESWTSPRYFQQSEEARVEAEKREKKKQTLTERREKLRTVLDNEQKSYEDEIKTILSSTVLTHLVPKNQLSPKIFWPSRLKNIMNQLNGLKMGATLYRHHPSF
ncbi:hypothetical protein J6590_055161 [Homalodisca vitripennis]|nr:hypothetical protein J6590_055161 [Homalodisca vitripennis]